MAKDSILNIILNIIKQGTGAEDTKSSLSGLGDQLTNVASGIMGDIVGFTSLAGAAYELYDQLKESIDEATQAETTIARLEATVQSTGRSSEISTPQIHALAEQMRGLFSTEDIESATNILMRFMDIPTDQIPADLVLIQNMAAGLGVTLPEAANTLGMALETGRLRGLGFSREMQNTISTMMSAGDIAGADAIIMDQLNSKFSGQEAAALDTYAGKQAIVSNDFKEMKISVGDFFLPALKAADDEIIRSLNGWEQLGIYLDHATQTGNTQQLDTLQLSLTSVTKVYSDLQATIGDQTPTNQQELALEHLRFEIGYDQDAIAKLRNELGLTADKTDLYTIYNVDLTTTIKDSTTAQDQQAAVLRGLNMTLDDTDIYMTAYNDHMEKSKSTSEAATAGMQAVEKADKEMNKEIQDTTSWEEMYTSAKSTTDRTSALMDLMKNHIQSMATVAGVSASSVWEGYMEATGKIEPAAVLQFAELEAFLAVEIPKIQSYIARGMSLSMVGKGLEADLAAAGFSDLSGNPSPPSGHSPSSYDTGQKNQYGEMWYDPVAKQYFSKKAAGGPVEPNSYLWNEDASTRPEVFVSNGGQILTNQDAKDALGGGGTTLVLHYQPMISFADEEELKNRLYPLVDQLIQRSKGRI
jgi:HPt (histidine-containing phosphotransfer) domain-containing protein